MEASQIALGIDLGTTGIKSGAFDEQLHCLCTFQTENRLIHPAPGLVEQDPGHFIESAKLLIRKIVAELGKASENIAAIACSGQMAGIMGVDADWNPVGHYDAIWDPRSNSYRPMVEEHQEQILRVGGGLTTQLEKMLYWRDHFTEAYDRSVKFIAPNAYLAGQLAGLRGEDAFTDPTFGSVSGVMDPVALDWDQDILDAFDLPREKLPAIYEPQTVVGLVDPDVAKELGLPTGVKVLAGAGDGAATYAGSGVNEPGQALDLSGTACALGIYVEDFMPDVEKRFFLNMRSPITSGWYLIYVNLFGSTHRWFVDAFCPDLVQQDNYDEVYDFLDKEAAEIDAGSDGLFAILHLSGRGSPPKPHYRGSWVGFRNGFIRSHFYRSLLEAHAVEYAAAMSYLSQVTKGLQVREVVVSGGGAKSDFWSQLKASVLGVKYKRLANSDLSTLRGDAMIAAKALGWSALDKHATFFEFDREYQPDPEITERYEGVIRAYEAFNNSMDSVLASMYT